MVVEVRSVLQTIEVRPPKFHHWARPTMRLVDIPVVALLRPSRVLVVVGVALQNLPSIVEELPEMVVVVYGRVELALEVFDSNSAPVRFK